MQFDDTMVSYHTWVLRRNIKGRELDWGSDLIMDRKAMRWWLWVFLRRYHWWLLFSAYNTKWITIILILVDAHCRWKGDRYSLLTTTIDDSSFLGKLYYDIIIWMKAVGSRRDGGSRELFEGIYWSFMTLLHILEEQDHLTIEYYIDVMFKETPRADGSFSSLCRCF